MDHLELCMYVSASDETALHLSKPSTEMPLLMKLLSLDSSIHHTCPLQMVCDGRSSESYLGVLSVAVYCVVGSK